MSFGVYIHIPYCLQRCTYCDFATYERGKILPSNQYVELVREEIRQKQGAFRDRTLSTVYFGGGTPSLLPSSEILALLVELEKQGFDRSPDAELTIEINPATVDPRKLAVYQNAGINRYSVGAQTFDDPLLKSVRREHSAQQTRETLGLLSGEKLNYSFDLLFALPGQTLDILKRDLDEVLKFQPPHVSPYCLTVPEGHPLAKNRPLEDVQLEMFELIRTTLESAGYHRYEISNFARPGFESRHNSLYWEDESYWGLGLSAHSYAVEAGPFGTRFWNPPAIASYQDLIEKHRGRTFRSPVENLSEDGFERLHAAQSLTDFCHTSLRRKKGLDLRALQKKFGETGARLVTGPLEQMRQQGWLQPERSQVYRLSEEGLLISNQVFANLTFFAEEWEKASVTAGI